jgi:hypothetical protein
MRWEMGSGEEEDAAEEEEEEARRAHEGFLEAASRLRPGEPARPVEGSDESSE